MKGSLPQGSDVDPITGDIEAAKEDIQKGEEKWLRKYNALISDLAGEGGEVMKLVATALEHRINELMKNDSTCKELLAILGTVQHGINVGEKIVRSKMPKQGEE